MNFQGAYWVVGVIVAWLLIIKLINIIIKWLERLNANQLAQAEAEKTRKEAEQKQLTTIANMFQWEYDGELLHCRCAPKNNLTIKYLRCEVPSNSEKLKNKGDTLLTINGSESYDTVGTRHLHAIAKGLTTYNITDSQLVWGKIYPNDRFLSINTSEQAIAEYIAQQEREAEERRRIALEEEKAEIAAKIKEKHRRHQLEKLVRQELIDSGELFGEQHKRPQIPREVVDAVYRRDGGRCVYCGATENLHLDHIIPFSCGGATSVENLQLLCQKCNLEKSNKIG
ncbi:MAG: HNH endonuclease [Alistipes sp.]|nr:HNH endonuclease [Alistipes sp.]